MQAERELARKLEAVGQLAAGIAHEINTPIQFVGDTIGFLQDAFADLLTLTAAYEELEAGAAPEPLARVRAAAAAADLEYLRERVPGAFERGAEGIARVAAIVRAMRDFAHPTAMAQAPADLVAALRNTLVVASHEYRYVADVETDLHPLPRVLCNVGELNQVFLNLIVNAAHAIASVVEPAGGRGTISIRARHEGSDVVISIADTGCGIPADVAGRVFDPFFTTKDVGGGTGQGLAIARTMVVERHGGALTFESRPGHGTTFHVRLPVGAAQAS
jgi:signal transduction histidine kinase